jgi:hypothetical protein
MHPEFISCLGRQPCVITSPHHHATLSTFFWLKLTRTQATKITDWVKPGDTSGEFKRQQSSFRNWISREPGAQFPPEKGRYHLYVSYACPWVSISWQRSAG